MKLWLKLALSDPHRSFMSYVIETIFQWIAAGCICYIFYQGVRHTPQWINGLLIVTILGYCFVYRGTE